MLKKIITLLLFFLLTQFTVFSTPIPNYQIKETFEELSIKEAIKWFQSDNKFYINGFVNKGLTNHILWLKIDGKNEHQFIQLKNPRLNIIKVFYLKNNTVVDSMITGDFFKFNNKHLPLFTFKIKPNISLYLAIDHKGSTLQMPIIIDSVENIHIQQQKTILQIAFIIGALFLAFFFSLFLFFTSKTINYLSFTLYLLNAIIWLCLTSGLAYQFILTNHPQFNNRLEVSSGALIAVLFVLNMLNFTKKYSSNNNLKQWLKIVMYVLLVWAIIPLLPFISLSYSKSTPIYLYTFFVVNIIGVVLSFCYLIQLIPQGKLSIKFFLLAVMNTLIFTIIISLYNLGFINISFSTELVVSTGILIDVIFMTLALTYQFNQYKETNQLLTIEKMQQEMIMENKLVNLQMEERNRISKEMHDDIGARLTQITLMSDHLKKTNPTYEAVAISETSRKIVSSMNEIIWSLNTEYKSLQDLFNYLREQLNHLLEFSKIEYQINFPEHVQYIELTNQYRRNIVLIVKEAVHNAIKYSQAKKIIVAASLHKTILQFKIIDDGIGFDIKTKSSGNGLKNIQQRIAEINGHIKIISNNKGTQILFEVLM